MEYKLTTPCNDCPFRSDKKFHLSEGRVNNITRGLLYQNTPFSCHKTTTQAGKKCEDKGSQHCAGALIFLEQMHRPHLAMVLGEKLGLYDSSKLDKSIPIYTTTAKMVRGCE